MGNRWSIAALRSLLVLVVLSLACAPERRSSPREGSDASAGSSPLATSAGGATPSLSVLPGQPSAPINVGEVVRRVHFAYRAEGDGFAGGHSTFAVRGKANGQVSFTPYRYVAHDRTATAGASLQLETRSFARGSGALSFEPPTAQVDDDGALVIARGSVAEKFRNDERGAEQSWVFASLPRGDGDLVIRLRVSGLEYTGETKAGLHFLDKKTGLGVRYGAASWVDAAGRRVPVALRFADGDVILVVSAASVDQASYPAVLDPTISVEYGTDNPVNGPAPGQEAKPGIAFGGGNYFVVWQDDRAGVTSVYGTRVSTAGAALDLAGIPIASGTVATASTCSGAHCGPQAAFDGTNFLVTWIDIRNGSTNGDVYGAFVSSSGVLGTTNLAIGTAAADQMWISMAFDGTNYLVVWTEFGTTYNVHGSLVSKTGVVQGTPSFTITSDFEAYAPVVAFDGTNYLVVWDYGNSGGSWQIHGSRVSTSGTPLDNPSLNLTTGIFSQTGPTIAYDSSNYMLVYAQEAGGGNTHLYFKRISTAGVVVPADAAGVALCTATGSQREPNLAFDGANNFFVVWNDSYLTRGARVSKTGLLQDGPATSPGIQIGGAAQYTQYNSTVAFGGGSYLVAWNTAFAGGDINGSIVTTAAVPGAAFTIAKTANAQHAPAVAFDGTNYLVVWEDYRPGVANLDIYGARVNKLGVIQDPSGISIASATGNQLAPAVVFDGSSYYVAWEDHRGSDADIYGSPVSKLERRSS